MAQDKPPNLCYSSFTHKPDMKKVYSLKIREHEEYGENGIVIGGLGRDYFDPAMTGMTCAHDILEHPTRPHPNGYIDELMALGALIAGRWSAGWRNPFGFSIITAGLISDVSSLINYSHAEGELIGIPPISRYLQDGDLMEEMREIVTKGVKSGLEEYYDSDESNAMIKARRQYKINVLTSYVVMGYRAYKRRFRNYDNYTISVLLFNKIAEVCDRFLKGGEESREAKLHVDFSRGHAWVEDDY